MLRQKSLVQLLLVLWGKLQDHILHLLDSVFLSVNDEVNIDEQEKASDQKGVNSVNNATIGKNVTDVVCLESSLKSSEKESTKWSNQSNKTCYNEQVDGDW